jgi:HEPN domain-containing protein
MRAEDGWNKLLKISNGPNSIPDSIPARIYTKKAAKEAVELAEEIVEFIKTTLGFHQIP